MSGRVASIAEVFSVFLRLGCTSFGGPVAHIAYFRSEFVERKKWLDESQFAQLLAICQFLPGPASSQLGFSIGLQRAGLFGAIAAFIAFTLPSVLLLLLFVWCLPLLPAEAAKAGVDGLKIVAVVVVAQGVWGMMKQLCPEAFRQAIALFSAVFVLLLPFTSSQVLLVVLAAFIGWCCLSKQARLMPSLKLNDQAKPINIKLNPMLSWGCALLFFVLLLVLPPLSSDSHFLQQLVAPFYQAGALVFGGGHVVLPLLEQSLVQTNLVEADQFIAGYGASQAIPGPMFAFAAYLGAVMAPVGSSAVMAALIAIVAMFLPGFLLLLAFLPFWQKLGKTPMAASVVAVVNAAVVGILLAALYDPIFTQAMKASYFMPIVLVGFVIQNVWKKSVLYLVAWCVIASVAVNYI